MNYIKLNNSQYEILSFNRYTNFNDGTITSTASCSIKTADSASLYTLGSQTITSLQILHDEDVIYNLENINATISVLSETLSDNRMLIDMNLQFN